MKRARKLVAALTVCAMAFTLTACGGGNDAKSNCCNWSYTIGQIAEATFCISQTFQVCTFQSTQQFLSHFTVQYGISFFIAAKQERPGHSDCIAERRH